MLQKLPGAEELDGGDSGSRKAVDCSEDEI